MPDSLLRSRPRERIQFSNLSLSTLSRVSVAIPWPQIVMAGYSSAWIGKAVVDTVVRIGLSSQFWYASRDTAAATAI